MKTKLLKNIYLTVVALLLFACTGLYGGIVYQVTNTALGTPGSIDKVLSQAIIDANAGQAVTILFKAPGLCQLSAQLQVINITNGSITMDKDPLATVEQGIQYASAAGDNSITSGFSIFNSTANTFVVIKNITIRDFIPNPNLKVRVGINLSDCYNVTIERCKLENNNCSIMYTRTINLLINNNEFINNGAEGAIELNELFGSAPACNSKITNNHFYLTSASTQNPVSGIEVASLPNLAMNHDVQIKGNLIEGYTTGINVANHSGLSSVDNTFKVNISNNTLKNNQFNLVLFYPYNHFIVENNNLSVNNVSGINIDIRSSPAAALPNPYGLNLINVNSASIPVFNSNNVFSGTPYPDYISVRTTGNFGKGVNIIGQTLPGRVVITDGRYTMVRENRITSNSPPNLPINLVTGNKDIAPPQLLNALLNGAALNIQYRLNGNQHVNNNADFIVEFFKSNANGDLLNYIGNQIRSSLNGGTYTVNLTVPSGMSINAGDRIAATVTGLGNRMPPNLAVTTGTSEAAYITLSGCSGCRKIEFTAPSPICKNEPTVFTNISSACSGNPAFLWDFGDGTPVSATNIHTYTSAGTYTVKLFINTSYPECPAQSITKSVTVLECIQLCINCIGSFSPDSGTYVLGAWVREDINDPNVLTYTKPRIYIDFPTTTNPGGPFSSPSAGPFTAEGRIIDGWQRIESTFTILKSATYINISLQCLSGNCFFDDIRIFPVDGSMKSYVYDPINLRLVAELDERNYATLYEYDEEGKLVRVKKETVNGVVTIKENKNSSTKKQ